MTNEAKSTPGPWHYGSGNGEGYVFGPEGTRRDDLGLHAICEINGIGPENEANARLIASAPELLEACKLACERLNDDTNHNALTVIRAAIAKAEGRI